MEQLAIYAAIGFAGGILSGMFGVGGGLILIPLMTIFLKMGQHQAQGASLGIIMFSFVSMLVYYKNGYVDLKVVVLIGIGFILGGLISSHIAVSLPENILKKCFGVFLIVVACKMLFFK
ncbi:MAG: sulfite exporter TauE/SafE family protein [Elusimicrobiota bacterium]|jgi:uncharacterized membrane protein YfcA|nr:sulfite exporter TauE/SafE family protein [Elusimicrobiota bacterium]